MSDNFWPNAISPSTSSWQTSTQIANPQSQFGRRIELIVGGSGTGENTLDLSNLEVDFRTSQGDFNAPPSALIRIFNPSKNTINRIQKEFNAVALQAGYIGGNFGVIFNGAIVQTKTGKIDNVTRYLDIAAIDGALFHLYGFVNASLKANASNLDQLNAMKQTLDKAGIITDSNVNSNISAIGGILPRGKVLYGLAPLYNDDLADKSNCTWFIENGILKFVPIKGYLPSEAVIINSNTGMIGIPEATEQGILVKCLLNPKIKVGTKIKLNQAEITQTKVNSYGLGLYPTYQSLPLFAQINTDGIYRVIVKEHIGQIRGNAWYTEIIALNIDQTSSQVQTNG
jgi:hypothetical protein